MTDMTAGIKRIICADKSMLSPKRTLAFKTPRSFDFIEPNARVYAVRPECEDEPVRE